MRGGAPHPALAGLIGPRSSLQLIDWPGSRLWWFPNRVASLAFFLPLETGRACDRRASGACTKAPGPVPRVGTTPGGCAYSLYRPRGIGSIGRAHLFPRRTAGQQRAQYPVPMIERTKLGELSLVDSVAVLK